MYSNKIFVLITGNARSGTTFISTQLEKMFDIAIPVESFFIPHFERYSALYNCNTKKHGAELLMQCVQDYLEISLYAGVKSAAPDKMLKNSILASIYQFRENIIQHQDYRTFLTQIFHHFAEERGSNRWGEKGMNYELETLDRYDRCLENLKVLHIVRDGRDVALSWMREWFGPKSVAESACLWRRHVRHYHDWGNKNPGRYLEIRYEDFLANHDTLLVDIGKFFGLDKKPEQSGQPVLQESLGNEVWARNISKPIIANNKDKWRTAMSLRDQLLFEYIAGKELLLFGYTCNFGYFDLKERIMCQYRLIAGYTRRAFDLNFYKRRIRRHMPLGLWLLRRFMSPLATLLIGKIVKRGWNRKDGDGQSS